MQKEESVLTPLEESLVVILKELGLNQTETIGVMLMLKQNPKKQEELFNYIRNSNPRDLTSRVIVDKVLEIMDAKK